MILAIDLGSSVSKAVFLDESLYLLKSAVTPTKGNFFETLKVLLGAVLDGQKVEAVKPAPENSSRSWRPCFTSRLRRSVHWRFKR